mgnify:CR=1 FL=1
MSGVWIKCDENGYPILGIVPDNMDATAFIKYMFKVLSADVTHLYFLSDSYSTQ